MLKKLFLLTILCLFSSVSWSQECIEGDCINGFGEYKYPTGAIYKGQWKDGQRSGKGETTSLNGEQYTGNYEDDSRSGYGIYVFPSGETYSGEWKNSSRHGFGELLYQNGITKYVGYFLNGKITGQGIKTYANGNKYDGEWVNSKYNGKGELTLKDGDKYKGTWKNDELLNGEYTSENFSYIGDFENGNFHGHGTLKFKSGTEYSGTWRNDYLPRGSYLNTKGTKYIGEFQDLEFHGKGELIIPNGPTYAGNFQNGKFHGKGKLSYSNGNIFIGNFENDYRSGQGTMNFSSGDSYVGQYMNGEAHGEGLYTWADGTSYSGTYSNGLRNGEGVMKNPNGDEISGIWVNGEPQPTQSTKKTSGTGFFINENGYFLTNHHTLEDCNKVEIITHNTNYEASVIATDEVNDLGLGKIDLTGNSYIKIGNGDLDKGEDILVAGFPLSGQLSDDVKITKGIISSLSGFSNNYSKFQFDAAVQPGNSGGPILNRYGEWVGVAESMAKDDYFYELSGQYPENVNFAIKSNVALAFLKANKVKTKSNFFLFRRYIENTEVAKIAEDASLQTQCFKEVNED